MMKNAENGDVKITKIALSNKNLNASVSILDQCVSFDVFEDMSKPTMFATFEMFDSIGLLSTFPIIGEETVEVEFATPGLQPTSVKFRCYEVANVVRAENGKMMNYIMKCVSEEHLRNGSNVVAQSFNQPLSKTVVDILSQYLKTTKDVIVDDTRGTQNIVMPRLTPLQSIDFCRRRSTSVKYSSSSYVFFENQKGFAFKTVEGLIEDGLPTIGSRTFNFIDNSTIDKESQQLSNRRVIDYQNITNVDTVRNINNGLHYAVTDTFDLLEKKFSTTSFKLSEHYSKFLTTNKDDQITNTSRFVDDFASATPRRFFVPVDKSRPEQFIENMLPARNAYVLLLNQNTTRIKINGDSGLKVGDVITLNAPEQSGTTGKRTDDKIITGNYMIVRLRHMVKNTTVPKHYVVFDCVRVGIPK